MNQPAHDEKLRSFLTTLACCLAALVVMGGIFAGVLVYRIDAMSGWGSREAEGTPVYSQAQIDKFITSVLIVVQNDPLASGGGRADLAFIASFDAFEQRLTMVGLAPDMLIEQGGEKLTLNESYITGGPGLMVNLINQNFGLDIQHYACTDTHSLAAMIDLLGGIPTTITRREANYIKDAMGIMSLQPGEVTLSGTESMVHAMDNITGGAELGGIQRSLKLVESAVSNMRKTATKEAMLPLLSLVFSSIRTNLDFSTLHDLGYEILKADEMEYESISIPWEGTWRGSITPGQDIRVNLEPNGEKLREVLYGMKAE